MHIVVKSDGYLDIEVCIMIRNANATDVSIHDAWRRQ